MPVYAPEVRNRDAIIKYYRDIDANDLNAVLSLFANGAVDSLGRFVSVRGEFRGTAHGRPLFTRFRDAWDFDRDGRVRYRRSWLEVDGI